MTSAIAPCYRLRTTDRARPRPTVGGCGGRWLAMNLPMRRHANRPTRPRASCCGSNLPRPVSRWPLRKRPSCWIGPNWNTWRWRNLQPVRRRPMRMRSDRRCLPARERMRYLPLPAKCTTASAAQWLKMTRKAPTRAIWLVACSSTAKPQSGRNRHRVSRRPWRSDGSIRIAGTGRWAACFIVLPTAARLSWCWSSAFADPGPVGQSAHAGVAARRHSRDTVISV